MREGEINGVIAVRRKGFDSRGHQNETKLYTMDFDANEENMAFEWDDKNPTSCTSVIARG